MRIGRLTLLFLLALGGGVWAWAGLSSGRQLAPVVVLRVESGRRGAEFAPGTIGLSTEAAELGDGDLTASRERLVRLMRLLGPSVLRIGGKSVNLSWWTSAGERAPAWATNTVTPADLTGLRGLMEATGWHALLGVDLGHFAPSRAASEAYYAEEILGGYLAGVEIGNAPNDFGDPDIHLRSRTYDQARYLREVTRYRTALNGAAPGVAIYGPASEGSAWLTELGSSASLFDELTEHYYPKTSAEERCVEADPASNAEPTAGEILSPTVRTQEDETLSALATAGEVAGRPTRIGETGSSPCGGDSPAAPEFASALWALDWSLRAASSGVQGVNFHGHLKHCGPDNQSPVCADAGTTLTAQPEFYGLLAARQLEGGQFVPTVLEGRSSSLSSLTSWATIAPSGTMKVAIENFSLSGEPQPIRVDVPGYALAKAAPLRAPSATALSAVTLASSRVTAEARWRPAARRLRPQSHGFKVLVAPASAVIVTLRHAHPPAAASSSARAQRKARSPHGDGL